MEYTLRIGEDLRAYNVELRDGALIVSSGENTYEVSCTRLSDNHLSLSVNGRRIDAFILRDERGKTVMIKGSSYEVVDVDRIRSSGEKGARDESPGIVTSPMPATVVAIKVSEGEAVKKNQPVIVVSAMKMEMTLKAPYDGVVAKINVPVGAGVMPGMVLVDIDKSE